MVKIKKVEEIIESLKNSEAKDEYSLEYIIENFNSKLEVFIENSINELGDVYCDTQLPKDINFDFTSSSETAKRFKKELKKNGYNLEVFHRVSEAPDRDWHFCWVTWE